MENKENVIDPIKEVDELVKKAQVALDEFLNLNQEIVEVAEAAGTIDQKMLTLSDLVDSVVQSVENLSELAKENAVRTEETTISINDLKESIIQCKEETISLVQLSAALKQQSHQFEI